ncbi:hypothetical protein [Nocardia asteroides]|uniref:hypothetical protein n=1 Tax=Nocardia asteroides TaxID=1824 RepID=UPI00364A93BF
MRPTAFTRLTTHRSKHAVLAALTVVATAMSVAACSSADGTATSPASTTAMSVAPTTAAVVSDADFIRDLRSNRTYMLSNSDQSLIDLAKTSARAFPEGISDAEWRSTYESVRDILTQSGFTRDLSKEFIVKSVKYYGTPASYAQAVRLAATITELRTVITAGIYIAGTDIESGTYKTDGASSCYYELRRDPTSGAVSNIIENDNLSGPGYLTVDDGQGVKVSGGCVFTKVEPK